jgi:hypothetical protein
VKNKKASLVEIYKPQTRKFPYISRRNGVFWVHSPTSPGWFVLTRKNDRFEAYFIDFKGFFFEKGICHMSFASRENMYFVLSIDILFFYACID